MLLAKPLNGIYEPTKRVIFKVKHGRECDCVVGGFRWYRKGSVESVGSLLLGLFDSAGVLQHAGVCSSFAAETRCELVKLLAPYRKNALLKHPVFVGRIGNAEAHLTHRGYAKLCRELEKVNPSEF